MELLAIVNGVVARGSLPLFEVSGQPRQVYGAADAVFRQEIRIATAADGPQGLVYRGGMRRWLIRMSFGQDVFPVRGARIAQASDPSRLSALHTAIDVGREAGRIGAAAGFNMPKHQGP